MIPYDQTPPETDWVPSSKHGMGAYILTAKNCHKATTIITPKVSAIWDYRDLAGKICDDLIHKGELKVSPAFIRRDREAKLTEVFKHSNLNGAEILSLPSYEALQIRIRLYAYGQVWVEQVLSSILRMLPQGSNIYSKLIEKRHMSHE